ncbi:MAG: heavy metal translocating P-type ATPase [Thermogemmatispora sp.]|uniref:heavy metal translocating P-type ATPase n=1 Tax=Thermogemmatispora sp. TaxID=1968838 RepID=UPI00261235BB|nr:heavy metal translocating P-type ATPase [Thermogemmatispora sp.]MBX5457516.1 heavy metal translocating P-type ATPase [Thermogemmatispora sp.]
MPVIHRRQSALQQRQPVPEDGEESTAPLSSQYIPAQLAPIQPPQRFGLKALMDLLRHYPLPSAALMLLLVASLSWLIGRADLAHWTLLVITVIGGIPLSWQTLQQLSRRELSVDLIAILAIIGALLAGEYLAGAFVVLMLSGGEALEAYALRQARRSLSALAERAPRISHIWRGQELVDLPAEEIEAGMVVVVKPGELVPVDGTVVTGSSYVSEADLTGEALPQPKAVGATVLSGSLNLDRPLEVRASRRSIESKYAQIVRLVAAAQEQKAPLHRLADRYSVLFTAASLSLAALAWLLTGSGITALAVLVVATPCPLILATPIAIMSGIDRAARAGIIVKSGATVEALGEVQVAVFDKTGTLTLGVPSVSRLWRAPASEVPAEAPLLDDATLLRLAASVEQLSSHILARAIVESARAQGLVPGLTEQFQEVFGKGAAGRVRLTAAPEEPVYEVTVGNRTFLRQRGIALPPALLQAREQWTAAGQIASFLAVNGYCLALIVLEDRPRADLAQLMADLKQAGIEETVLLTGDGEEVAQRIRALAGMDRAVARCLPEEKVQVIRDYLNRGRKVLMVGDGVNDAPALATATVGIAMGQQGLTAAASVADAVLLSEEVQRIATAVRLGRGVMRIARQGIWVGMGLSATAMLLAAFGWIPPAAGAILQEGIDVLVIFNALRVSHIPLR